jgi:RND superfamily putative drug exporter
VLAAWAILVLLSMPLASRQLDRLTSGGFEVSGSQSAVAEQTLRQRFPELTGERLAILLRGSADVTTHDYRDALVRVEHALDAGRGIVLSERALPGIRGNGLGKDAADRVARTIHGRVALVPLDVRLTVRETIDRAAELRATLGLARPQSGPVDIQLVGRSAQVAAVHDASEDGVRGAESFGFPAVLLILLAVFGSFAAAALPLLVGIVSVVVTGGLIYLLSGAFTMSVFVVNVASMIGIGVAVDYSLFMLARYREELAAGRDEATARSRMLATSGRAVAFAGGTVVVSLATVFLLDNTILRSIAAGAMLVVTIAVLVSVTALPALIGLLGRRLHAPSPLVGRVVVRVRSLAHGRRPPPEEPFWMRWTRRVMRRPLLNAFAASALLLVLSAPVLALALGVDTVRQLRRDDPARRAAEVAAAIQGPGSDSPVIVSATPNGTGQPVSTVVATVRRALVRDREILHVAQTRTAPGDGTLLIAAIPRHDPESDAGLAAVRRLREQMAAESAQLAGWQVAVGGTSATIADAADQIADNLWKVVVAVLLLSFVVLLALLRSVVLPLKAIAMNLLTVGAATGVLVAVFQWGWLEGLGIESLGHLEIYVPPLVFAVVFGVSMDYEIFLMTRIRERYEATGDNETAIAEGVASSAGVITSAALIMVIVFSIFVATNVPIVQELGLGTAIAIALDATVTRLMLLPATMTLLGDLNWWMPTRLRRVGASSRLPRRAGESRR